MKIVPTRMSASSADDATTVRRGGIRSRSARWIEASTNRRVFEAAAVVGGLTLIVSVASMVKDLIVARQFGLSAEIDAFLLAFVVPSTILSVVGASLGSALIPAYVRVREFGGVAKAQHLFADVTGWSIVVLAGTAVALAAVTPWLLPLLTGNFGRTKVALTVSLLYWLLPIVVVGGVASAWSAVLNASERFAFAALAPIAVPLATILAIVTARHALGIYALAVGTVAGTVLQLAILGWALHRRGLAVRPHWLGITPELREVWSQYWPIVAGSALMSGTVLIDQAMAAHLAPGSVAALSYGTKVVSLVIGLSGAAIATAILPHMSRLIANEDWASLRDMLRTYTRLLLLVTVPGTALLVALSPAIVRLLFEGQAFTVDDTTLVARVQALFALQIPFYACGLPWVRLLSALQRNVTLMRITVASLVANIAGNLLFMRLYGAPGIALSTSLVYLVSCLMIVWAGRRRLIWAETHSRMQRRSAASAVVDEGL